MMNLTPTEMDRLTIFTAAELARAYRSKGIRLSHPEAVALITDEVMTAARQDRSYDDVRDMSSRLLTTDDVEPGVAEMIPLVVLEGPFASGNKMIAIFDPIAPGEQPLGADYVIPGEVITPDEELVIFPDLPVARLEVVNTGDRDIQVRSQSHFFEANRALNFDRAAAWGLKLDVPSGAGMRFEPGIVKQVNLVPISGLRVVLGQGGLAAGPLDVEGELLLALDRARAEGYLGA
jgi:urease subunit gamma/beta